jgi:hypothetical protein
MSEVRQFVHRPSGTLCRYVREILWVRSHHSRIQVLLTLVLRQLGEASLHNQNLPSTIVSGLQKRTRTVEHAPGSSLIIVRFTEVKRPGHIRLWDTGKPLTEIVFAAGYCDQPHMMRDSQLFTGTSPEQFFHTASPRDLPTFYK